MRKRAREIGIAPGRYQPGKCNAITDVAGVRVGHSTIIRGHGAHKAGKGPVRTGVTAILPNAGNIFYERVVGGGFVLNGAGEISGLTQVMEWGLIETPILLTNTLSVGAVSEGTVKYMVEHYPGIGKEHDVLIPVVGECDDSFLNDIAGRHVRSANVYEAIQTATDGPVAEGNVGGGTGMVCSDFKGGIGTSSRRLPREDGGYKVGVLVMSNFGRMVDLRMDGVPVGALLAPDYVKQEKRRTIYGSIITVVATNAPLLPHQIARLCKRAALGIGRVGSYAAHGSGEIVIGFSTANTVPRQTRKMEYRVRALLDPRMDPLYAATIEATEEAILNALCMAETMEGIDGHLAPELPLDRVQEIIARYAPARERFSEPEPLRDGDTWTGPGDQVLREHRLGPVRPPKIPEE
ncbi:MAG: P1 family peptidase [Deltaproteobacteria bacterium]|nr:P1 family peptidase [Deltaproteobacteria bacterium]